jgi:small GTP-binding protein
MDLPWLRIVVVGHVDHGKSTLIGRLLHDSGALPDGRLEEIARSSHGDAIEWAFLMDHFHEEREQERTIDSTQAFFATPKRIYRIIDAPGHVEFLKNMVTGAAQADAAVLVVDVEAGVLEQTRRHVAMLAMLGRRRAIVTINKMDSGGGRRERFEAVADAALSLLRQVNIAAHAVIPISARYGWNLASCAGEIAWYDGPTLFEALDSLALPEPLSQLPLRFPVQDIYDFNGRRRIVGRIESGRMAQGQTVLCLPSGRTARIASVERFLEDRTSAEAGESIGVTLDEPTESQAGSLCHQSQSQAGSLCHQVRRGEVLCNPETPASVARRIEANVFWLADRGWARGDALLLRCTTQEVPCRIESVRRRINSSTFETIESNAARLEATEVGHVVIAVQQPLVVDEFAAGEPLGRFVLLKDDELSAGGTVTRAIS